MKANSMIKTGLLASLAICPLTSMAQTPTGVPEPGVILYGKVLANDGSTTLPPSALTVVMRFSGQINPSAVIPVTVGPGKDHETYYVARLGFGNISAVGGTSSNLGSSEIQFNYPSSPTSYTLNTLPIISGGSGLTYSSSNSGLTVPAPYSSSFTFPNSVPADGEDERGQMIRMDIQSTVAPPVEDYDTWASRYGWNPSHANYGRTLDVDNDGMTNEAEWVFGTDPTNSHSNAELHKFVMYVKPVSGQPNAKDITFRPKYTNGTRTYSIHKSTDLGITVPFSAPSPVITITDGASVGTNVVEAEARDTNATESKAFYRIHGTINGVAP